MKFELYEPFEKRINKYEQLAMSYLRKEKCDLAAFYIGAVMHYIADMSSFFHVLDFNYDEIYDETSPYTKKEQKIHIKALHGYFEKAVFEVTKDHNNPKEFFNYETDFSIASGRDSFECAKLLAFDTRWNLLEDEIDMRDLHASPAWEPGIYQAKWLLTEFDEYMIGSRSNVYKWPVNFKLRVEDNLQNAIGFCADAINYIADAWETKTCSDCQKSDKAPVQTQRLQKVATAFVSALMFLGIASVEITPLLIAIATTTAKAEVAIPIAG